MGLFLHFSCTPTPFPWRSRSRLDRARPDREPRRNDQIGISLRQMPLPALIAAAQEIEIKGVF